MNTNDMIDLLKTHIKNKDFDKTILLIKEHPEVLDSKDNQGSSGFMIIAYSGQQEVLKLALTLMKTFTFYEAIVSGHLDNVQEYLDTPEFDLINTHSPDGFTPLALASFLNQHKIALLLLDHGADPNISATNPSNVNALHAAVAQENYELCKIFLEKGAIVNATQTQQVTALHSAVHRGNLKLVQLLITHGASITNKMDNGDSALSIAEKEGQEEILEYLLKNQ
ncbi:ankyrin repeat domain-containing protein [Dokdonia sp.]|uniref:ankyrin repeat domain-containing protein n=1 Tax=Dokdonia sp. TaxID=2024995 RepID=UPI00326578F7